MNRCIKHNVCKRHVMPCHVIGPRALRWVRIHSMHPSKNLHKARVLPDCNRHCVLTAAVGKKGLYGRWNAFVYGENPIRMDPVNIPAVLLWWFHTLPWAVGLSLPAFSGSPPPEKEEKKTNQTLHTKLLDANLFGWRCPSLPSVILNQQKNLHKVKMVNTTMFSFRWSIQ